MHRLDIGISRNACLSQLPPNAALFDASERNAVVAVVTTVDPDHPCFDIPRDAVRSRQVLGEDG